MIKTYIWQAHSQNWSRGDHLAPPSSCPILLSRFLILFPSSPLEAIQTIIVGCQGSCHHDAHDLTRTRKSTRSGSQSLQTRDARSAMKCHEMPGYTCCFCRVLSNICLFMSFLTGVSMFYGKRAYRGHHMRPFFVRLTTAQNRALVHSKQEDENIALNKNGNSKVCLVGHRPLYGSSLQYLESD